MSIEEYEIHLRNQLADLHREYARLAEPILKRLGELQALKPMPPLIISLEQARRVGLYVDAAASAAEIGKAMP